MRTCSHREKETKEKKKKSEIVKEKWRYSKHSQVGVRWSVHTEWEKEHNERERNVWKTLKASKAHN